MRKLLTFLIALASIVFAVVSPASAAVTDLGNAQTFANTQTLALTPSAAVPSGALAVLFVRDANASITGAGVTDTKGNTWFLAASELAPAPGNLEMFYSFLTTALTTSDTITYTTATGFGAVGMEMSACYTTGYSAVDGATAAATSNGFSSSFTVTGAGSAAVANEIYFAFVMANSTISATPSGWTTSSPSTPDPGLFLAAWQINTGTSPLTFAGTMTGANWASAVIASFKPIGGAAVIPGALRPGPVIGLH